MTLNRWFAVLVSTAALIGCVETTDPSAVNRMNATWAGRGWSGDASAVVLKNLPGGDRLYLSATGPSPIRSAAWWSPDNAVWANLISVEVPFKGVGTYVLAPGSATFKEMTGGDVLDATYSIAPQTTGTLVITSYEPDGIIEGTLSFDAVSSNPYRSFGDRASLEDAHFRAQVQPGFLL